MPANGTDVVAALADPTRRSIFEMVARRPSAVADIADALPVSRPAVSQHLKVLKEAALVKARPDGARRIYSLDPAGIAAARAYFDQFWQTSLESFREAAERTYHREAESQEES